MIENIKAKDFPQASGVYWFIDENDEIVYVGSSKNIYGRMTMHRHRIKDINFSLQSDLYDFLRKNTFTVCFALSNDYEKLEMDMLKKYKPKFNINKNNKFLTKEERNIGNKYNKKLCNYNGEIFTIHALATKFFREGITNHRKEAAKYLIE